MILGKELNLGCFICKMGIKIRLPCRIAVRINWVNSYEVIGPPLLLFLLPVRQRLCFMYMFASPVPARSMVQTGFTTAFIERKKGSTKEQINKPEINSRPMMIFFKKYFILRARERERERERLETTNRKIMTWAEIESRMLNRVSHPGAPRPKLIFNWFTMTQV